MNNPTATLNGHHGTLRITILGFESPDATDAHDEWLVARVEWESRTATVWHQGAILLSTELDTLAAALVGTSRPRCRSLRFIEPNFSMTRSASAEGATHERVTIAITGEPRDAEQAFEAATTGCPDEIRAFGRALQRVAASFRARAWRAAA